jgi:hypothetical protein
MVGLAHGGEFLPCAGWFELTFRDPDAGKNADTPEINLFLSII